MEGVIVMPQVMMTYDSRTVTTADRRQSFGGVRPALVTEGVALPTDGSRLRPTGLLSKRQ